MFYSLTGTLTYFDQKFAVIDCGGVGFKCGISLNTMSGLPDTGEMLTLYTHLNVKEDALDLFGFGTLEELELFKLLITVSGVGAKVAIAMLSAIPPDRLSLSIAAGDAKGLKAPGVGPKLAERIILELSGKIGSISPAAVGVTSVRSAVRASSASSEAIEALTALGFTGTEAAAAISKCEAGLSTEELISQALRALSVK